jgi:hypothetical protein
MSGGLRNGFITCGPCFPYRTNQFPAAPCFPAFPPNCGNNGCPVIIDTVCAIYHKDNSQISQLKNLGLPNGSPAQLIFDTIDGQLGNINVGNWSLPFLKGIYTPLTTLPQFGLAVDTQLSLLTDAVEALQSGATFSSNNTDSVDIILSGAFNNHIEANVNISATSGNRVSIVADGLLVPPQGLSVDYTAKTLTITDGNTVELAPLLTSPAGFLGNLASDPSSPEDGDYWWNTSSNQLKISVNGGTIKVITTS